MRAIALYTWKGAENWAHKFSLGYVRTFMHSAVDDVVEAHATALS